MYASLLDCWFLGTFKIYLFTYGDFLFPSMCFTISFVITISQIHIFIFFNRFPNSHKQVFVPTKFYSPPAIMRNGMNVNKCDEMMMRRY